MEQVTYITKKTPQEAQKEMEEKTKIELSKLTQRISQNPELLKPKFLIDSDSESSDSDFIDSDDDSSVSSESSSLPSRQSNALVIFKKDQKIDKLEERNYYKALEMTNLMLENSNLKEELAIVKNKYDDSIKFVDFIKDLIELKEKCKSEDINISLDEKLPVITSKMLDLQRKHENFKNKIIELNNKLNSFEPSVKKYFHNEIVSINDINMQNYSKNYKLINDHLENLSNIKSTKSILRYSFTFGVILYMISPFFTKLFSP